MAAVLKMLDPTAVAEGEARSSVERGLDAHEEFGRARAERDHGETDDEGGYAESVGQRRCPAHEAVGPDRGQDEADDELEHRDPHATTILG